MTGATALRLIVRSWVALLVGAIVGVGAAYALVTLTPISYQASSAVFVSISPAKSVNDLNQGAVFTQQVVHSYADVIPTSYILRPVISRLGLKESVSKLAAQITATAGIDTTIITITVDDAKASRAAAIANAISDQISQAAPVLIPSSADKPAVTVRIVQPASRPQSPASASASRTLLIGGALGLVLALAVVLLRFRLRTRPGSVAEVETVGGAPVLGSFKKTDLAPFRFVDWASTAARQRSEASRTLRANLGPILARLQHPVLIVTSSRSGESKVALAAQIAVEYASVGTSVLIVDADLQNQGLAPYTEALPESGVSRYVSGEHHLAVATQKILDGQVTVLGPETGPANDEYMADEALQQLLNETAGSFGMTVVVVPPLLESSDGLVFAQQASGVLLACAPRRVRSAQLETASKSLSQAGGHLLGIAITQTPRHFQTTRRSTRRLRKRGND